MSGTSGISWVRTQLREMPILVTSMLVGGVLLGVIGAVVGLVIGLYSHPPTAWFAALEIGFPAGVVGWLVGIPVGLIARWITRAPRGGPDPVDDDFAGTPPGW